MGNPAASDPLPYGVILAGGEGRRMGGQDKAFIPFAGQPLIVHAMARLAPQVAALAISAQGDAARFSRFDLPVLPDPVAGRQGPLAGILAAMIWAGHHGARHVVCVPVDGPFLPVDLARRLGCAAVPRLAICADRQHPTFGVWPSDLAQPLHDFLASGAVPRLRDFAAAVRAEWVDIPVPEAFENLNSPEDLARAERRQ